MAERSAAVRPILLDRDQLTPPMMSLVTQYESRFAVRFARFVLMTSDALRGVANPEPVAGPQAIGGALTANATTLVDRLTMIANQSHISTEERESYRDALEQIYRALPTHAVTEALVVAPKREGAILARRLGWLTDKYIQPHVKRMPFEDGLLIGCDSGLEEMKAATIHLVDGALASGATAMTILALGQPAIVKIFCAHATTEGLAALSRFARDAGIQLTCVVGEVSGVLNDHFYAVVPEAPHQLRVGDLGDMIAPLESSSDQAEFD